MRGGSGPSGLDDDGWGRILVSNTYGTVNIYLRKAFAEVIKKICIKKIEINVETIEASIRNVFRM